MTGCLAKGTEPGTFMLTDLEKGPKSVGIVSSTANLAPHVGHKVELTGTAVPAKDRSEEHTSELQSHLNLVCRLLLEKKNDQKHTPFLRNHQGHALIHKNDRARIVPVARQRHKFPYVTTQLSIRDKGLRSIHHRSQHV